MTKRTHIQICAGCSKEFERPRDKSGRLTRPKYCKPCGKLARDRHNREIAKSRKAQREIKYDPTKMRSRPCNQCGKHHASLSPRLSSTGKKLFKSSCRACEAKTKSEHHKRKQAVLNKARRFSEDFSLANLLLQQAYSLLRYTHTNHTVTRLLGEYLTKEKPWS